MKMYKIENILSLLEFEKEENCNEYVGFEINDSGNAVLVFKEHEPDWVDEEGFGEAAEEVELLESEGEYW